MGQWKKELQEQASSVFEGKCGPKPTADQEASPERLYAEIGRLKVDWLKKSLRYSNEHAPRLDRRSRVHWPYAAMFTRRRGAARGIRVTLAGRLFDSAFHVSSDVF